MHLFPCLTLSKTLCYTWLSLDHENSHHRSGTLSQLGIPPHYFHLSSSVYGCYKKYSVFLPLFFHAMSTAFLSSLLNCFCLCSFTPCLHLFPLYKYLLNKLQKIQNNAVGLIRTVPNTDHISPHLLLSIGCPLIHEYSINSLLYATSAPTLQLMSTWLNSGRFAKQSASYAFLLLLPFLVVPPAYAHTRLVRDLFLMLHRLSETVFLSKLDRQTH